jgi:peptidoglycan/xylan/chitin deacetylase (PgdA/CDA1 family)
MKSILRTLVISVGLLLIPTIAAASVASTTVATSTPQSKEVALTFDDGPYGTSTQEVLDILKKEQVPATFFLVGKNVEEYPALAKEIVQDGNAVGNHTYDHPKNLTKMSVQKVDLELSKAELAIASSTGVQTKLFRPPYGNMTKKLRSQIKKEGYPIVLWNVDPKDWNDASSTSAVIIQNVLAHLQNQMIIVLHDGRDTHIGYPRDNLIIALPILIEDLKQRGYSFVTADLLTKNKRECTMLPCLITN